MVWLEASSPPSTSRFTAPESAWILASPIEHHVPSCAFVWMSRVIIAGAPDKVYVTVTLLSAFWTISTPDTDGTDGAANDITGNDNAIPAVIIWHFFIMLLPYRKFSMGNRRTYHPYAGI
jgi:hypothetical protein